jgi:hypothetical protein
MNFHTPKWTPILGVGVLTYSPNFQRVIARVKTPHLEEIFISLEIYWKVNVWNGLAWPIWTSETQLMAKRKVRSQTGSLTPDHEKSGVNPIPLHASGLQHTVGKLLRRATTSLETSSRSEVYKRSYHRAKSREVQPWRFQDSHLGVPGQKNHLDEGVAERCRVYYIGEDGGFPKFELWWVWNRHGLS